MDGSAIDSTAVRAIVFHKRPVSARTRFLQLGYGGVCGFKPLPTLSSLVSRDQQTPVIVEPHPQVVIRWVAKHSGLSSAVLELEQEFREFVDIPKGRLTIYLVAIRGYDVPAEQLAKTRGKMIPITETWELVAVEKELLRQAYEVVLGGY
jgi:hypothetical protein